MSKLNMVKNRLLCCAMLAATVSFVLFYGGRVPYVMLYTAVALVAVSLLYLLITKLLCDVVCSIDRRDVVKGEDVVLTIEIKNNSPLFIPYVNIANKRMFEFDYDIKDVSLSIAAHSGKRARISMTSKYRGRYDVNIPEVRLMDFLGIANVAVKYPKLPEVLVYPRVCEIDEFSAVGKFDMDNQRNPDNITEDVTAVSDVREYMHGDTMRKIHWNLSARMMSFMAKNYENITKSRLTMLLNLSQAADGTAEAAGAARAAGAAGAVKVAGATGAAGAARVAGVAGAAEAASAVGAAGAARSVVAVGETKLRLEDKMVETAVSIVFHFLTRFWNVTLCYYENEYYSYSLSDVGMFGMAYDHLAFVGFSSVYDIAKIVENVSSETAGERLNLCVITQEVTDELLDRVMRCSELGSRIALIYVCDSKPGLGVPEWAGALQKSAVSLYVIDCDSELRELESYGLKLS